MVQTGNAFFDEFPHSDQLHGRCFVRQSLFKIAYLAAYVLNAFFQYIRFTVKFGDLVIINPDQNFVARRGR
jgi:hypothetical protein